MRLPCLRPPAPAAAALLAALALPAGPAAADDAGMLTRLLQDQLSDAGREVRITGFRGALSSQATIEELTIADDEGVWLTLRGATLDWNRSALFARALQVRELTAEELVVERLPGRGPGQPPAPEATPFALPELPISVQIGQIGIDRVSLGEPVLGTATELRLEGSAALAGGEGGADLAVERIDGRDGTLRLEGRFSNTTRVLALDLELAEGAGGIAASLMGLPGTPSLRLAVAGDGPLEGFRADIALETDGAPRLTGVVELSEDPPEAGGTRHFRAEIAGDVAPLFAPDYQDFFGTAVALRVEGARFADGRTALTGLDLQADEVQLSAQVALNPGGLPERIAVDGRIASRDGSPVLLPLPGPRTELAGARIELAFDAAVGDEWHGTVAIDDLRRPGLAVTGLALEGVGRIAGNGAGAEVAANLRFGADGLALDDAALSEALGTEVTGHARLVWKQGRPLELSSFGLLGEDYGLTGRGAIDGARLSGRVDAQLDALARFSGLADRPLDGALHGALEGNANVLSGTLDAEVLVTGRDLSIGQPEVDNLLAGVSRFRGGVTRDFDGLALRELNVAARTLTAELDGVLRSTGSDLDARLDFTDLSVLGEGYGGAMAAEGRLIAENGAQRLVFDATGRDLALGIDELDRLLAGEALLALEAVQEGGATEVERFTLRATTLSAEAAGRLDGALSDFTGTLDFSDLSVLGEGYRGAVAAEGRVTGEGGAQRIRLNALGDGIAVGIAEVDALLGGQTRLELAALSAGGVTEVERLHLDAGGLVADVSGRLAEGLVEFAGRLDLPDLAALGAAYGGALSAEGTFRQAGGAQTVILDATARDLAVGIGEVDGLLAGTARIALDATRTGEAIAVNRFALNTATGLTATAEGRIAPEGSDFTAEAALADLGVLGPAYRGSVRGEGRIVDAAGRQRLDFTATARDIGIGVAEVDRLLAGETRLAGEGTLADGIVDITRFTLATASELTARVSGRIGGEASELVADISLASLRALGPRYGGRIDAEARLSQRGPERRLSLSARGQNLAVGIPEADTVLRGASTLALEASQQGERLRVQSLRISTPLLAADASATIENSTRRLDLTARLANLGALVPGFDGPVNVSGRITDAPGGYAIDIGGSGPGGIEARVAGRMGQDLSAALAITGTGNLALANRFVDPINVQGAARFDLRLDGPPGLSALSGTLTTTGARVVSPAAGVTLEQIDAAARLAGGTLNLEADARVQGGGRVGATGRIELAPRFPADLAVTLRNARITDRRIFETRVSGDLAIDGPLVRGGRIRGTLNLSDTEVRIPSTGLGAAGYIPPNMVHLGETPEQRLTRLRARLNGDGDTAESRNPFALDLTLSSPNRVFIRGRGLDAELGGALRLTGTTDDVVPSGEFGLLRGRLDILGRRFSLSDGIARLQGRFVPFVRLTATTVTDGITASIILAGEADALEISFQSVPELPEEEIVARILFGRTLDRLSPFQAAQLASAVATLAGRSGEGLVGNLRRGFGLDDLDVSTTEGGTAALRLGRYIGENIYTDVTVGSDGRSEVSINLDVTPSVTVRARTDNTGRSGVGIFFERDY